MSSSLQFSVHVAAPIPFKKLDGAHGGTWSPISSTLIYGKEEAVLVDTPITKAQNIELGDWIERTIANKKLTTIYITHGHADHWLGIGYLKKRFPGVSAVATTGTIEHMNQQIQPEQWQSRYGTMFPGQIDEDFVLAEPLPPNAEFGLEGHALKAVEVGHSDTHDSTVLWVPSIRLAVCGDVIYGDVHQQLSYANTEALRHEWIRAIEKVEALDPDMVVPGHKRASEPNGISHLQASKEYIRKFEEFLEGGAKDPEDLFQLMTTHYPTRFNTLPLAASCAAVFAQKKVGL